MAKKKEETAKIVLEREYVVNLRREFIKAPRWKKTKKALRGLKVFLAKHMKAEDKDIRIGKYLNLELWKHGMKNPPHHVKLVAKKDDKGIVTAELFGAPKEEKKEEKKKKAKKEEKPAEKPKTETKPKEKKEAPKEAPKKEEPKPEAKPAPKPEEKK